MIDKDALDIMETSVVASIIREPHLLSTLDLKPEHFYFEINREIISAFKTSGISMEIAIKASKPFVPDAKVHVMDIVDSIVSTSGADSNAVLIKQEAARRALKAQGQLFIDALANGAAPADAASEMARMATQIASSGSASSIGSVATMMDDLAEYDKEDEGDIVFGIEGLYVRRGQLVVPAARPGCGKSALVLQMCQEVGQDGPVMNFCGEMSRKEVWVRAMCQFHRRPIRPDMINFKEAAARYNAWARENLTMFLDDKDCIDIDELVSKATAQHYKTPLRMIVVDYLQKVRCSYMKERFGQVTEVAIRLKKLARDLNVPVVAPAQLNREISGKPLMSHLRDSGQIEQEADQIWLLSGADTHDPVVTVNLEVAKHRGGPTGDMGIEFNKPSYTMRKTV